MNYFEEESKKWKIYEQVASRKEPELDKNGDDVLMREVEEIPQARPVRERYSAILDMTITDTDSQGNENSNLEYKEEASHSDSNSSSSSNSIDEEDKKKKRKLHDTSLSPTSKEKVTSGKENNIRKKKTTSKKKKRVAIENDPRAPEGSPVFIVSEGSK
ncbi:unnamed protein product [Rotaria magnacalcarata]|uniref:Uncharacterized protein n=2 Tax=Rotaria magnacalcarata TaxID=392030 RepID=A0A816M537_9BILA|nr:unnamed protein product [Rotaria magnacalcarata]CAF1973599.1 unnamed protein product [Rotaria magnacalcarata]CAF4299417.1 unnamed protein product [Rotaria magnacalcarata]